MRRLLKGSGRFLWRIGVLIVGSVLLVIGIIMIVTPGPAVVFIPLGLGVLATEFQWARNILHRVRPMIDAAIAKAKQVKQRHSKSPDEATPDEQSAVSGCADGKQRRPPLLTNAADVVVSGQRSGERPA